MKVLLINGSPNEKRCTYTALAEVAKSLHTEGIETEIAWIGTDPVRGCDGCAGCTKRGDQRCIHHDDVINHLLDLAEKADGIVVGTPVFYAGANGALIAVLDRMFRAGSAVMAHKPGASIASARRAGTTCAIDQLNKYFLFNNMPLVSSNYWPMVHGQSVEQVKRDEEGLQIMRILGQNMAWLLQCVEAGKTAGINTPLLERKIATNFIDPLKNSID
ncbi:MAG: flavodoxin family protein [Raoultibacter sp.]